MPNNQPCYERDFLTLVVLRADFPALKVEPGPVDNRFTDAIKDRYPHVATVPVRELMVKVTETGNELQQIERGHQHTYRKGVDDTFNVAFGPTFLAMEYGPDDYKGRGEMQAEFTSLLQTLHSLRGVKEFSRIGLRYVNEIRLPGRATDWNGIIREELISSVFAKPITGGRMLRSMHQLCELHDENQLLINYGLANPDYPSVLVQRHFVLDIDCSRSGAISVTEASECISDLNNLAGNAFEASVDDKLREIMGKKND